VANVLGNEKIKETKMLIRKEKSPSGKSVFASPDEERKTA